MSKTKPTPDTEILHSLMRYDPETGLLYWKARTSEHFQNGGHLAAHNVAKWNGKHAGKEAFTATKGDGYKHGALFGQNYSAHRIIWKMVHGEDADRIDHINGVRADNRLLNLRSVSTAISASARICCSARRSATSSTCRAWPAIRRSRRCSSAKG